MSQDLAKLQVAQHLVKIIPQYEIIALGSGTTVNKIIEEISKAEYQIKVISGSSSTSLKLAECGIEEIALSSLSNGIIPLCIDGADQVIKGEEIQILKGHGGAFVREKILWKLSTKIYVGVDYTKMVNEFTEYLPIEITPFALNLVLNKVKSLPVESLKSKLRTYGSSHMPVISDNHNYILDLFFDKAINDPHEINSTIKQFTGVVDTGLFLGEDTSNAEVLIGYPERVEKLDRFN